MKTVHSLEVWYLELLGGRAGHSACVKFHRVLLAALLFYALDHVLRNNWQTLQEECCAFQAVGTLFRGAWHPRVAISLGL